MNQFAISGVNIWHQPKQCTILQWNPSNLPEKHAALFVSPPKMGGILMTPGETPKSQTKEEKIQ